eukprot:5264787-Prorocentrum_lima.AAC.1
MYASGGARVNREEQQAWPRPCQPGTALMESQLQRDPSSLGALVSSFAGDRKSRQLLAALG